jgi:hypothetical protein
VSERRDQLDTAWEALEFELPPAPGGPGTGWRRVTDTRLDSPRDICGWDEAPLLESSMFLVQPRSVVFLVAESR